MRFAVAVLALGLAACKPGDPPPAPQPASPPIKQTSIDDIRGEWRLVRINARRADEEPPDAEIPAAIRLVVGERTLRGYSQCVSFAWRYETTDAGIALAPDNPGPMCARGLTNWEREFERVLNRATEARIVDGHLRLTGAAGELEFSSAPAPAPVELTGEWVLRRLDGGSAPGVGDPPQTIRVAITGDTIRAQSQCVFYWWRYRQSGEQVETTPEEAGPVCDRTRTEWEQRFKRAIDDANIVHRLDEETLILAGASGQAELQRQD